MCLQVDVLRVWCCELFDSENDTMGHHTVDLNFGDFVYVYNVAVQGMHHVSTVVNAVEISFVVQKPYEEGFDVSVVSNDVESAFVVSDVCVDVVVYGFGIAGHCCCMTSFLFGVATDAMNYYSDVHVAK